MGDYSIIIPKTATNLFTDPQFHRADPDTKWTLYGDGEEDVTRSTAEQWIGTGCAVVDLGGGTYVIIYQELTTTSTAYMLSARIKRAAGGAVTATQCTAHFNSTALAWGSITPLRDNWYLCTKTGTATAGTRNFGVRCLEDGMFVDAMQLENTAYRTTYVDGDQPGCEWNGTDHASTSTRSALSRSGGRVDDLDDYDMYVEMPTGGGMPRIQHHSQGYALLPGSYHQGMKVQDRTLILRIWAKGTSLSDLHDERQAFLKVIEPDSAKGTQPFILRYSGATVTKDISVRYVAGMEGGRFEGYKEQLVLRLLAEDPFWYARGEASTALDSNGTKNTRYIMARLNGTWSSLSVDAGGGTVRAIKVGPDKNIYVGHLGLDWDGVAAADYICYYDVATETWNALGTGANDGVYTLEFAPDGDLYAGGAFSVMGGVGNTSRIARWTGSAWNAMGTGVTGTGAVLGIAIGHDGYVYAVGSFTAMGGIANTYGVARWRSGAWTSIGETNVFKINCVAVGLDGKIYVGGAFTTIGGVAANRIAYWDGTAWNAMGTGAGFDVIGVDIGLDGMVYIAANTTNIGGIADADYVARWNGASWDSLGTGLDNTARGIHVAPDGMVYVCGSFTKAGDIDLPDALARWNGTTWTHVDINLPATPSVYCVETSAADPAVPTNHDLYVGHSTIGITYNSGSTWVTNNGTRPAHPRIEIKRSGGTSAAIYSVRNETTGKELFLDYDLQDGETVVIDCRPGQVGFTSDFWGNRADALLRGSDMATFTLDPGANKISSFVDITGAPTINAYIVWRDTYWSAD